MPLIECPDPEYALERETVRLEVEWTPPRELTSKLNTGRQYTRVTTFNDATFVVWIDSGRRPRVTKLSEAGVLTEFLDPNPDYRSRDDGHHKFSIAVDADGYVHVAGDMHHYPNDPESQDHLPRRYQDRHVLYWVSYAPMDISSFDFVGDDSARAIPGEGFTHIWFDTDNQGRLYAASRQQARSSGWSPGRVGTGVARYDADSRRWTALGAPADTPNSNGEKMLFWEDAGVDGTGYQGGGNDLRFDGGSRMHVAATFNHDSSTSGSTNASNTLVLYAYSDDAGQTFRRAGGTPVAALPLSRDTADVVAEAHWLTSEVGVTTTCQRAPVVSYRHQGGGAGPSWRSFKIGGWLPDERLPSWCQGMKPYLGHDGVLTATCNKKVYRSLAPGGPLMVHDLPHIMFDMDRRHLRATGKLRVMLELRFDDPSEALDLDGDGELETHGEIGVARLVIEPG